MAVHKDLTGADLHEPKGAATASSGQVYIANGLGSGVWTNKNADILNANHFPLNGYLPDIGAAGAPTGSVYFWVAQRSEIVNLSSVLTAAITGADSILSIYINGVLFADTLTVPFTSSAAGSNNVLAVTTANTVPANSVIEVRSNGGATNSVASNITLHMRNKT